MLICWIRDFYCTYFFAFNAHISLKIRIKIHVVYIFLLIYHQAYEGSIDALPSKDQWEHLELRFTVRPPHAKRPTGIPRSRESEREMKKKMGRER